MNSEPAFPLPWEHVLWSASSAFPAALRPRKYAFTNLRLVATRRNRTINELALDDIESITLTQAWWQRVTGTSTVHVRSRRDGSVLELANIHHGPQLAFVLQLRATELFEDDTRALDPEFFRSALKPVETPLVGPHHRRFAIAATVVFAAVLGMITLTRQSSLPPVVYANDDPVAPHGDRRPTEQIMAFMEQEVMPFARQALGPLVGGAASVTCETCHGSDGAQRNWRMPGVRALPEPQLRLAGLERARSWLDPQMRNAVYGYIAEEDKQSIAAYMRQVVMPGMAKLMHRPAYDFAKSYGYNRSRAAVGCYHCHLVE